jgi:flavin-dependent dehydrogenase
VPKRATKRGAERTALSGDYDVIICGASFAGLTVARQLAGSGARVMLLDRYEVGERQTSACGIPTCWLEAMGLGASARQEFDTLVIHTPHGTSRYRLPWSFTTFDYRELCDLLFAACDAEFETAQVEGLAPLPAGAQNGAAANGARAGLGRPLGVVTDRGTLNAPLVVDAMGWKRVLGTLYQPPDAPLSRGLEVHPPGNGRDMEIWIDRRYVPAGYAWSFPARDEVRVGVGSFDPKFHVKRSTVLLAQDLGRETVGYQGNWIPHKLRRATEGEVFFVGDSAGHCLPLTAEGIRTAFYFGIALGEELRAVVEGRKDRAQALRDYAAFHDRHEWKFRWMLRAQRAVPRLPARAQRALVATVGVERLVRWSFGHYLRIAPPEFAQRYARVPQAVGAAA